MPNKYCLTVGPHRTLVTSPMGGVLLYDTELDANLAAQGVAVALARQHNKPITVYASKIVDVYGWSENPSPLPLPPESSNGEEAV